MAVTPQSKFDVTLPTQDNATPPDTLAARLPGKHQRQGTVAGNNPKDVHPGRHGCLMPP